MTEDQYLNMHYGTEYPTIIELLGEIKTLEAENERLKSELGLALFGSGLRTEGDKS